MNRFAVIAGLIAVSVASPAAADEFVAYFEPGRAILGPHGYQMIRRAAAYAQAGQLERVTISGHMDTLEAHDYSEELALARAHAVATELVLLGVDPAVIIQTSRGARVLARPTSDRVGRASEPAGDRRDQFYPPDRPPLTFAPNFGAL